MLYNLLWKKSCKNVIQLNVENVVKMLLNVVKMLYKCYTNVVKCCKNVVKCCQLFRVNGWVM